MNARLCRTLQNEIVLRDGWNTFEVNKANMHGLGTVQSRGNNTLVCITCMHQRMTENESIASTQ